MSVCTPDLGLTEKTYTTPQESQPLERVVTVKGAWKLSGTYSDPVFGTDVQCAPQGGKTVLTVTCRHGHPVEFILIPSI